MYSAGADKPAITGTEVSGIPSTPFGRAMRNAHFNFAPTYTPLNHGSFGTHPIAVRHFQHMLQREADERPDTFIRFKYPGLLLEAREAVAPLLGANTDEVVLVPNALTGINTVLRNLDFEEGDVILYFSTIYGACLNTIRSLEETTCVRSYAMELTYPIEDQEILAYFRAAVLQIQVQGEKVKVATFDTVLTFPGVRFPWEALVCICSEYGILSCVDGAHGIGHIDLMHLGRVSPDFFISNCYKWLMTPRGCSILYVPHRNHRIIKTTFPTGEGYLAPPQRPSTSFLTPTEYFVNLFERVSTVDSSPYVCVLEALRFRTSVCGGEERIRSYCTALARQGGEIMARILETEVLGNKTDGSSHSRMRDCCFANVRLPLDINNGNKDETSNTPAGIPTGKLNSDGSKPVHMNTLEGISPDEGHIVADWITERSVNEFDSFIATRYYGGAFWVRISSQIYLELADFIWAARVLLDLCDRAGKGKWRRAASRSSSMSPIIHPSSGALV